MKGEEEEEEKEEEFKSKVNLMWLLNKRVCKKGIMARARPAWRVP